MREEREVWFEEIRQFCQIGDGGGREIGEEGDNVGGAGSVDVEEEGWVGVRGWESRQGCASDVPSGRVGHRSIGWG